MAFRRTPPQPLCFGHHVGLELCPALASFNLAVGFTFALASSPELCNEPCLFVLMKRAGDLAHHDARWIAAIGQVVAVGRENADTAIDQREDPELLGDELAGKAAGIFHDDRADPIPFNPVQQCSEACPCFDSIQAGVVRLPAL
jgi:hypothetical protein